MSSLQYILLETQLPLHCSECGLPAHRTQSLHPSVWLAAHVVAVKYDEKVTDYAARVFAEQFCESRYPCLLQEDNLDETNDLTFSACTSSFRPFARHGQHGSERFSGKAGRSSSSPEMVTWGTWRPRADEGSCSWAGRWASCPSWRRVRRRRTRRSSCCCPRTATMTWPSSATRSSVRGLALPCQLDHTAGGRC